MALAVPDTGSEEALETARLRLVPLAAGVLRALLCGERERAEALLGAALPEVWPMPDAVLRLRLSQVERAPADAPWLTRAIVLREATRVVGVAGFHGPPGGDWLRDVAPGGVELGYTVVPADRRRGFAFEACDALLAWAFAVHRVGACVLSIAPDNHPSAALAHKLGFSKIGEWRHETRGLEHIHRRPGAPPG